MQGLSYVDNLVLARVPGIWPQDRCLAVQMGKLHDLEVLVFPGGVRRRQDDLELEWKKLNTPHLSLPSPPLAIFIKIL